MKNHLQIFENEEFGKIRILDIGSQPWWVLKDVCNVLGLTNPSVIADRLDDDERAKFNLGRQGLANIINESGLYAVILRSDKPKAKGFRRWITSEVIPSIRKHGAYISDTVLEEAINSQDFAFDLFQKLQSEKGKNVALLDKVERLAPKARYCDQILQCGNAVPVTLIARDYGMTAVAFNRILNDLDVQFRIGPTCNDKILYMESPY